MSRAIILHGTGGSPEGNWFPWLGGELTEAGASVLIPRFPTPEGQSLDCWMEVFARQAGELRGDDVVIGHSMGCGFALRMLEGAREPVRASFFAAGFLGAIGNEYYDNLNASFFDEDIDWDRIRENAGIVKCYRGSDDPYVPAAKGEEFGRIMGCKPVVIEGGGHLNADRGFSKFELLRDDVLKVIQMPGARGNARS